VLRVFSDSRAAPAFFYSNRARIASLFVSLQDRDAQ
jgi:hypothetical protein